MLTTIKITIKTNRHWYPILYWYELTAKEQKENDWLDTEEKQQDATFVRYRNWVYEISQFSIVEHLPADNPICKWQGVHNDTFFSGVLINLANDGEYAQMGTCYS